MLTHQTAQKTDTSKQSATSKQNFEAPRNPAEFDSTLSLHSTLGNQAVQRLIETGAIQPKLKIGAPNDKYEQEADRVADQVMRMPAPKTSISPQQSVSVQRKCAACENGDSPCSECADEELVQRQAIKVGDIIQRRADIRTNALPSVPRVTNGVESRIHSLHGSGEPLSSRTRAFMEPRFGRDFSHVRVHTDAAANELADSVRAKSFTLGNDVVFGSGHYSPNSIYGQHLLAHELVHTLQQKSLPRRMLQRACSDGAEYDKRIAQIRALPTFKIIPEQDKRYSAETAKKQAEEVIRDAKNKDDCMYYANHLFNVFSTPVEIGPTSSGGSKGRQAGPLIVDAAKEEAKRLASQSKKSRDFEEDAVKSQARQWRKVAGPVYAEMGKADGVTFLPMTPWSYEVDDTDPSNIFIKLKVRITGAEPYRSKVMSMEDAIEKHASVLGYTINLTFVNEGGADVAEVGLNPDKGTDVSNWADDPESLAHEMHHLLNLDDSYNYIEGHSANKYKAIADRMFWYYTTFKAGGPDPLLGISFMGGGNIIADRDVCTAIQAPNLDDCVKKRMQVRLPGMKIKGNVQTRCFSLMNVLNGVMNPNLGSQRMGVSGTDNPLSRVQRMAVAVFGRTIPDRAIAQVCRDLYFTLKVTQIQMLNNVHPKCSGSPSLVETAHPTASFFICPSFMKDASEDQVKAMIVSAYKVYVTKKGKPNKSLFGGSVPTKIEWSNFIYHAYEVI